MKLFENPHYKKILFPLALIIVSMLPAWLYFSSRIPLGHDTFFYIPVQYFTLSNKAFTGEIPQWIPNIAHGMAANIIFLFQGSIFQNTILLFSSLLKSLNFLAVFYTGIAFAEITLLIGTWLLAKRYFSLAGTIFACLLTFGSSIWMLQFTFNFYMYHSIPLICYLIHRFLDTSHVRYAYLALLFIGLSPLCPAPYTLPVLTLAIFVYFACCPTEVYKIKNLLKNNKKSLILIVFSFIPFACLYLLTNYSKNEFFLLSNGRNPDGSTALDVFMTYAGNMSPFKWLQSLIAISPFKDYTLFMGSLAVPLCFMGLVLNHKKALKFVIPAVVLILLSSGTFISTLLYYVWPAMKYFRHLSIISAFAKLFLCFAATVGFDEFFVKKNQRYRKYFLAFNFMTALLLLSLILSTQMQTSVFSLLGDATKGSFFTYTGLPQFTFDEIITAYDLRRTLVFVCIFSIAVFVHPRLSYKHHAILLSVLLLVQFTELFIYKTSYTVLGSVKIPQNKFDSFQMSKIPYTETRSPFSNDERSSLFENELRGTILYESINLFTYLDPPIPIQRNDYWTRPLNNYLKTFLGLPAGNSAAPMIFPNNNAALQFSGITAPKIQFYSNALFVPTESRMATILAGKSFNGQLPLLLGQKTQDLSDMQNLEKPQMINLNYKVVDYSANHLLAEFNNLSNKNVWLVYADIWNPDWKVSVNGVEKPIYKANLAYKAVETQPGPNRVHFYFQSTMLNSIYILIMLHSALAFIVIIYYGIYVYRGKVEEERPFS